MSAQDAATRRVLIIGARSDIGRALARRAAQDGAAVVLAARNAVDLANDVKDLRLRFGIDATAIEIDVTTADPDTVLGRLQPPPTDVVMLVGALGSQEESLQNDTAAAAAMTANYLAPARWLLAAGRLLRLQGAGTIVAFSSVAGDRGRRSNFVYGSAKAGLTALLSGLRAELHEAGVHVLTVKPGFMDTAMTAGMKLSPLLTAQPEAVADVVWKAARARRNTIYVKSVWRPIMWIIRSIPESVFKRLPL